MCIRDRLDGIFEGDNPLAASNHYQVYIDGIEQQESFVTYVRDLEGVRKVTHSADTVFALLRIKKVAVSYTHLPGSDFLCVTIQYF